MRASIDLRGHGDCRKWGQTSCPVGVFVHSEPRYPKLSKGSAPFFWSLHAWLRCVGVSALLLTLGCAREDTLSYVEVDGTVNLAGKPLSGAVVEFHPIVSAGKEGLPFSRATTDGAGRYELICVNDRPGAVVGPHRVVVRWPDAPRNPEAPPKARAGPIIPLAYTVARDSPLRVQVVPERRIYDLNLSQR
jgi:hypothetical protein